MSSKNASLLAAICALLGAASPVIAGTVNLHGLTDGDSIYLEYASDAFFRMDLFDPPPRETQQRFHAISDPSVTFGSLALDGFPHDENFRLGTVTYNDAGLGGNGVAPITGVTLGVGADPADASYVNYARWTPINTTVDSFVGTVTLAAGQVTSIDLNSVVTLTIPAVANRQAPGTFTISGNRFDGHMETSNTATSPGDNRFVWDFAGTLTTVVPEPSSLLLAALGAAFLGRARGLRNRWLS